MSKKKCPKCPDSGVHYENHQFPKTYIKIGETGFAVMPHSEVCMHLRVAGRIMAFKMIGNKFEGNDKVRYHYSAQLINPLNGKEYSFPITLGEAGIFSEEYNDQYIYYYYVCPQIGPKEEPHVS